MNKKISSPVVTHREDGARAILSQSFMYNFFMRVVGYDRAMRCLADRYIRAAPGDRLLDIGCGTSIILEHLSSDIHYTGYDVNPRYIEESRRRHQGRSELAFICADVLETARQISGQCFDLATAISLIHHLSDEEAISLFNSAYQSLKPGGALITYDPVLHGNQSPLERWIMNHDRGAVIRTAEQYERLARSVFADVSIDIRTDMGWRIPATAIVMTCRREQGMERRLG